MEPEDWSLATAGASLLVAIAGTGIAVWQARIARRAATLSEKAADAAAAQALAAVEQANLLRRQLADDQRDRAQRDAPSFTLGFADEGEWGTWRTTRGDDREFVRISKANNPPVRDWVKRRTLVISHQRGPAVRVTVTLDGVSSDSAEVAMTDPVDLVQGATERIPLFTVQSLEGAELTVVITGEELRGAGRIWVTRRALPL